MPVCRTCLSKYDLLPLFSEHNAFSFSNTELYLVTGVEILRNDGLSQLICKTCIKLIENALTLREQSCKANAILKKGLIMDKVTVKVETNSLDIGDCKKICKLNKSVNIPENLDVSQDIYNTIDYDLLMGPCRNQNQVLINHKQEKILSNPIGIPTTSNSEIKIKKATSEYTCNIKTDNTIYKKDTSRHNPKGRNRKDAEKYSNQRPLCIDDLESSDSDTEADKVIKEDKIRIEDFESSDSFDVDMNSMSEEIKIKPSIVNLNMFEKSVVLVKDKKYLKYYKHATEKELWQKERRKMLTKEREKKYLALAVTPYNRDGPIQCRVCYSTVRSLNSFKTHAKTHFEPQFSCETCGKKFTSNSHMRYHQQRMHGRTKRLGCTHCPFRSVDRQTLRNHERAEHTGERPYTCNECGVSFRMRNNLIQHLRKHFGVKNMQCERCPAMFRSRSELWGHQTKVHFMTYKYFCYLCPDSYKGPGPVKKHLLNVHGVPESQQLKIKCVKTRKSQVQQ